METPQAVLLLPGQGAQRERMAAGLYGQDTEFTRHLDLFLAGYGKAGEALREQWLRPGPNPELDLARHAQPLLFAVGHALGRTVARWSNGPRTFLGHSVGELAAACLAGVFTPEDAPALMAARARALRGAEGGGMLAVAASTAELAPLTGADVTVAAVNGPRQTVVAGPGPALAATADRLRGAGFTVRATRSDVAFHTPALGPHADRFTRLIDVGRLRPPTHELISTRTARTVTPREAVSGEFWAGQLVTPVRYGEALSALLDARGTAPGLFLLDASADGGLSAAARRHPAVRSGASEVLPLLPPLTGGSRDLTVLAAARERLAGAARAAGPASRP
ncbi:acyltransferase domain-containing protein [Streptomyces sp. NPDC057702]|uniref:acyltransferase domain-containing protein n=1 Tax=unclassified Streptomyces TaxID=2593676 RepID=UPI0036AC99EA